MTNSLHINHLENYLTFYYEYLPRIKEHAPEHEDFVESTEEREGGENETSA